MTDFSEEPSDGFKIGIAILGVVRATENLWWKILLEIFQFDSGQLWPRSK